MKRLLVRCGALVLVASLFILALWPPQVRGEVGAGQDARQCRGKIDRLAGLANSGSTAQDSFSERELNAHLARILSRNRQAREARGLTVGVHDLRLTLVQGPTFFVDARLLSLPLIFTIKLRCAAESGPPKLDALAVGHLPFLGPLKNLAIRRMKPLFTQLRNEAIVWEHLASCQVHEASGNETLTVSVDGRPEQAVAAGQP